MTLAGRSIAPTVAVGLLLAALVSPASGDGWRAVPLFGADVRSLAFDPGDPERVLAGTSSGQIYESTDQGSTWRPAGDRVALPGWVVSALRFDPHRRGRVWAGLWALWGSNGSVAVSDDGGRSWQSRAEGLEAQQVYSLALASDRTDQIFAATRNGVWESGDAGRSWHHVTAGTPTMGKVTSLLVDPFDPDVLYAGSWRRAYRSDDRGATWQGIFEGMVLDSEVFSLRPGPGGEGDLWASTCGWVYHGRGRGARWQRHTNGLPERRTPSFEVLAGGRLLAGTVAGVYGSDDQGASWRRTSPEIGVNTIAAHPRHPDVVLVGSEGSGIWRSTDGGRSFRSSSAGMVSLRVTDIVGASDELALSVRHTERRDGVHRFAGSRLSIDEGTELPTVLDLAADGGALYAATERGLWRKVGAVWEPVPEFGEGRLEAVVVATDWIVGRSRSELISVRAGEVKRTPWESTGRTLALWSSAVWFTEKGRLWRWDLERPEGVEIPGDAMAVDVFGDDLVADTSAGRFRRGVGGRWSPLPVAGDRLLPTGDRGMPYLALWGRGRATLHDALGRERALFVVPVPVRDVSASVLLDGRLHLATAGYGLLWSNVLEIDETDRPVVGAYGSTGGG